MAQTTDFQPVFIQPAELTKYGLPLQDVDCNIMNKVRQASSGIDIHCMKKDENGYGSLIYSTYTERVTIKGHNPNVFRVSHRPLVGLSEAVVTSLQASGAVGENGTDGYDNGAVYSTAQRLNGKPGELSAIVAISGRYGRGRKGSQSDDMLFPLVTPANLSQLFGGAPTWIGLDPGQCDYNQQSGEIWAPPGLYLYRFSEVEVTYTAGFSPLRIPNNIKQACANIIKNMGVRPVPGVMSSNYTDAGLSMTFSPSWIDSWTEALLLPYRSVVTG